MPSTAANEITSEWLVWLTGRFRRREGERSLGERADALAPDVFLEHGEDSVINL